MTQGVLSEEISSDNCVSLVRCNNYRREEVCRSVRQAIDLLGGIDRFALPGERVLLKPNLLQGISPDRCVTTHPEVVYAVSHLLKEHGCKIVIADSPGGGIRYTPANLKRAYHAAGYDRVADELGVTLNLDTGVLDAPNPGGVLVKRFPLIHPLLDADRVIGVSKAKTHMWTLLSGAGKNLFGLIPGLEKPAFHSRFRDDQSFSRMILDLNRVVHADLHLMDAVYGMEGNGPLSGSPRHIGAILASPSSIALDFVAATLMDITPPDVPLLWCAMEQGLIRDDGRDITIKGDSIKDMVVCGYKKPHTFHGSGRSMQKNVTLSLVQHAGRIYDLRPAIARERCTGCGKCRTICPVQAISLVGTRAQIKSGACIRCYCCHEMCTESAVVLRRGIAGDVLARLFGMQEFIQ